MGSVQQNIMYDLKNVTFFWEINISLFLYGVFFLFLSSGITVNSFFFFLHLKCTCLLKYLCNPEVLAKASKHHYYCCSFEQTKPEGPILTI